LVMNIELIWRVRAALFRVSIEGRYFCASFKF